ncbi:hypothetical protein C8J57DRAFT_1498452 [Mycena rebaudengoi]|nr:hypothetical protein C8J57DRAFT_1498452 [Mycena rebaudengoi]
MAANAMGSPRRTHRKRVSLRLSSDTTHTLPEYIGQWRDVIPPPDYEADEDTDDDTTSSTYIAPAPISPRPKPLELSNTLLQSTMSTPSTSAFREPSPTAPGPVALPREPWADGLDEVTRDVEGLFDDRVSSSLPASTSPIRQPKRRPSLDPGLRYSPPQRTRLVSPAPRAMTQYVGSCGDPDAIALPSTLGLRAPSSDWRPGASLASTPSIPIVSARLPEPSTPAYNMLSSFVHSTPPLPIRRTSSIERSVPSPRIPQPSSSRKLPSPSPPRSRSRTPKNTIVSANTPRPMTPPVEENSASCSSSSSEGGPRAKLTLQSLRRILDEQPPPPPVPRTRFQPYTPPPRPQAVPSTATASVSRLFSRGGGGRHSVSIHAPPPSIMRPSGSGASTPNAKRISFAELPESYASTRPKNARSRKSKGKGKGKESKQGEPEGWLMWLVGGVADDRERLGVGGRSSSAWGGGRAGVDDWAV